MRLYFPDHKHIFYVIYQLTQDNLAMVRTLTQGEKKGKMECGTWCRAGLRLYFLQTEKCMVPSFCNLK